METKVYCKIGTKVPLYVYVCVHVIFEVFNKLFCIKNTFYFISAFSQTGASCLAIALQVDVTKNIHTYMVLDARSNAWVTNYNISYICLQGLRQFNSPHNFETKPNLTLTLLVILRSYDQSS